MSTDEELLDELTQWLTAADKGLARLEADMDAAGAPTASERAHQARDEVQAAAAIVQRLRPRHGHESEGPTAAP